jgi:NAD dependent epimerase/dehydratase family enzyme
LPINAVVLSPHGGALPALTRVFKSGLGGRIVSGRQWFPWIDGDDAVALVERALDDARVSGALNAVAPGVLRNADFTRALARKLHRPAFVPVPAFAVRLALGDLASELLDSRRVVPAVAESLAHPFTNPHL